MTTFYKNLGFTSYHMAIAAMLLVLSTSLNAATKEAAVKVGIIHNLTKFTVWPTDINQIKQFNVCVYATNLHEAFNALEGKVVMNKPVSIHHNIALNQIQSCQVLFIDKDSPFNLQKILKKAETLPILSVSDHPAFIEAGGMVGLIRDKTHVTFEVNLANVKTVGLTMSAQLLKLAKRVEGLN